MRNAWRIIRIFAGCSPIVGLRRFRPGPLSPAAFSRGTWITHPTS
jgi:hypothetical protein